MMDRRRFSIEEMVGKASSSFTPGSSMASVAGKNRLPTISCACASVADAERPAVSMAKAHGHELGHEFLNMESSSVAVTVRLAARKAAGYVRRRLEGPGQAWDQWRYRRAVQYRHCGGPAILIRAQSGQSPPHRVLTVARRRCTGCSGRRRGRARGLPAIDRRVR